MTQIDTPDRFVTAIRQAIETETHKIIEEEADAACERVRERMKRVVGNVTLSLLTHFDVERYGQDLRITIRNEAAGE